MHRTVRSLAKPEEVYGVATRKGSGSACRAVVHFVSAAALFAAVACASSPMMRAAEAGDRAALAREVAAQSTRGRFALADAASVAHAVVEHEIFHAATREDAVARIHDARACAFAVDDVLSRRMELGDSVSGEAALVRVEAGALSDGAARDHAHSADDSWRAVAMWGMTRRDDHEVRMRGLTDGSPLVRRSALHAIAERDDPAEFATVFDAARLDPEPLVRSAAVRVLARMSGAPQDLALRLRDLWTSSDESLREDLVIAFASPAILGAGGVEALAHLLQTTEGSDAVTIAGVILGSRVEDLALRAAATGVLVSAIKHGARNGRIHAIAVAPLAHGVGGGRPVAAETTLFVDALREASHADDVDVRLAALGRLSSPSVSMAVPAADRDQAIKALEGMAAPDALATVQSSRARLSLAEARDLRVQAWVEGDLGSKDAFARLSAADALAALGRAARAAPLLAD